MRFEYKPSFLKQYHKLHETAQRQIFAAIEKIIHFFETQEKPHGLGVKQLRKPYWEARVDIHKRLVFRFSGEFIEFVLLGNHDEIKRFLKQL